jgi:nitrogen fixation protein NifB
VQCNFCNRDYACVNESRPGVTSTALKPEPAVAYLREIWVNGPDIAVMGIAGPGDPFANPAETMETLRRARAEFPELMLGIASNGLGIAPHVRELAALRVGHVALTINTVAPRSARRSTPGSAMARASCAASKAHARLSASRWPRSSCSKIAGSSSRSTH